MTLPTIRVGVVGATGYSGMELMRLVHQHPQMTLTYAASSKGRVESFDELFPHLHKLTGVTVQPFDLDACLASCDLTFVALPSGNSGRIAGQLWHGGQYVIDLSGDLRLPGDVYQAWYHKEPVEPSIQEVAVYGLTEFYRDRVADAKLVANPGCYATATLLALKPLEIVHGMAANIPIIVDAKSGVTGAGRGANERTQFAELSDDFYAYKVGQHQHIPEIEHMLDTDQQILLTTQLLPIARGIFVSAYVPIEKELTEEEIYRHYLDVYQAEEFVHVLPRGRQPHVKSVKGSNNCHISLQVDARTGMLQVFSVIDNLQKGAAGQALQNANVMFGLPETLGLDTLSSWM
jgi:N-acetyl-gamma-glutamyl-phosphate reductase